jgi:Ca2+-binding RTX toxin-like protein
MHPARVQSRLAFPFFNTVFHGASHHVLRSHPRRHSLRPAGALIGRELTKESSVIGTGPNPNETAPPPFTGEGTEGDDTVHIRKASGFLGAALYDVEINGVHRLVTKEQLEATVFNLKGGNDTLIVDANVDADITALGGSGNDYTVGGAGHDKFDAGSGDNRLFGGDGNDSLRADSGNDFLDGGAGHDALDGGAGSNWVIWAGDDFVSGPSGQVSELNWR